jgi:hypothetical protein
LKLKMYAFNLIKDEGKMTPNQPLRLNIVNWLTDVFGILSEEAMIGEVAKLVDVGL